MNRAVMPITDYENTCDKIREKTETTDLIKSGEIPEKIDEVYEAGQASEYDRFWDAYQDYGNRRDYSRAFFNRWNDTTFNPKYDIVATAAYGTFAYSVMTAINATVDVSGAKNDGFLFGENASLETIKKIIVSDINTFSEWFLTCRALKNVTFEGTIGSNGLSFRDSPLLTDTTLRNIVGCLKDFSGTTETRSITFHADSVAKLEAVTEIANEQSVVNGVVTKGNLIEGQTYKISWYDSLYPGWLTGTETNPSSVKVVIEAVAKRISVRGTEYVGIEITGRNYVSDGGVVTYKLFQNEENICAVGVSDGSDIISISTKSLKEIANDKGWTVIEA